MSVIFAFNSEFISEWLCTNLSLVHSVKVFQW